MFSCKIEWRNIKSILIIKINEREWTSKSINFRQNVHNEIDLLMLDSCFCLFPLFYDSMAEVEVLCWGHCIWKQRQRLCNAHKHQSKHWSSSSINKNRNNVFMSRDYAIGFHFSWIHSTHKIKRFTPSIQPSQLNFYTPFHFASSNVKIQIQSNKIIPHVLFFKRLEIYVCSIVSICGCWLKLS